MMRSSLAVASASTIAARRVQIPLPIPVSHTPSPGTASVASATLLTTWERTASKSWDVKSSEPSRARGCPEDRFTTWVP